MNRELLSRRLTRQGWRVTLAATRSQGIRMAIETTPDLILLILMDMFKENPLTKEFGIVALTALAMSGDRQRASNAGCDVFETEPTDFLKLTSLIADEAVRRRKSCQ